MLLKIIMLLQNLIALLIIMLPLMLMIILFIIGHFSYKKIDSKKLIIKDVASCGKPVMNIMIETDAKEWEEYGL